MNNKAINSGVGSLNDSAVRYDSADGRPDEGEEMTPDTRYFRPLWDRIAYGPTKCMS